MDALLVAAILKDAGLAFEGPHGNYLVFLSFDT